MIGSGSQCAPGQPYGCSRGRFAHLRPRLSRRGAWSVATVVLLLALVEPLVCILHCELWFPAHAVAAATSHHGHHGHATPAAEAGGAARCHLGGAEDSSSTPAHVPPSPVHEAAPVAQPALPAPILALAALPALSVRTLFSAPPRLFRPPALALA